MSLAVAMAVMVAAATLKKEAVAATVAVVTMAVLLV